MTSRRTVLDVAPGGLSVPSATELKFGVAAAIAKLRDDDDVEDHPSLADEVASALGQLDELAELWGDEGKFRRCRDRLRAALKRDRE